MQEEYTFPNPHLSLAKNVNFPLYLANLSLLQNLFGCTLFQGKIPYEWNIKNHKINSNTFHMSNYRCMEVYPQLIGNKKHGSQHPKSHGNVSVS